jgi:hypothetical protein
MLEPVRANEPLDAVVRIGADARIRSEVLEGNVPSVAVEMKRGRRRPPDRPVEGAFGVVRKTAGSERLPVFRKVLQVPLFSLVEVKLVDDTLEDGVL